jgi:signal peptidase
MDAGTLTGHGPALERPKRPTARLLLSGGSLLLPVAIVVLWALLLRPASLGGPATYVIVSGPSMEPGLRTGDLVVAMPRSSYAAGDVIVYRVPEGEPAAGSVVIHRVVGKNVRGFVLQGDNKESSDLWHPSSEDVLGRAELTLPRVGAGLVLLRSPLGLGLAAGIAALLLVLVGSLGSSRRPRD